MNVFGCGLVGLYLILILLGGVYGLIVICVDCWFVV